MRVKRILLGAILFTPLLPESALAAGSIADNGQAITTSQYSIDLYQGPVLAGTRVTGLAGAFVAIAEDVDGDLQNPASPANRPFFSVSFFDWWLGLGFILPGALQKMDYFNSGSDTQLYNSPSSLVFLTPSLNLQWGPWGMGLTSEISSYDFKQSDGEPGTAEPSSSAFGALITTSHLQIARSFLEGQLVTGLGSRVLALNLNSGEDGSSAFSTAGSGIEAGVLLRPTGYPFRIGASTHSRVVTRARYSDKLLPDENGDVVVEGSDGGTIYVPRQVALPWDVNVGAAVQLGKRPLNLGWSKADVADERAQLEYELRELSRKEELERQLSMAASKEERAQIKAEYRYARKVDLAYKNRQRDAAYWAEQQQLADMSRFYLLVSASVVISGRAESAVGVESFLNQVVNRSGEATVYSPRLGLESEVWPNMLKLRGGSYLEPTRFDSGSPRVHGTAGLDLKLIRWSVFGIGPDDYLWRLALSADVAERYFTWGIMVGGWYPRHMGKIADRWLN